jgi:hypothetical protein
MTSNESIELTLVTFLFFDLLDELFSSAAVDDEVDEITGGRIDTDDVE